MRGRTLLQLRKRIQKKRIHREDWYDKRQINWAKGIHERWELAGVGHEVMVP